MTSAGHRLRAMAHKHLKESECAALKHAIQSFRETKSVLNLSTTLRNLLNTKDKISLLVAIFPMIPQDLQADFDRLCCLHFEGYQSHIRPQILDTYGFPLGSRVPSGEAVQIQGGRRQKRKSSRVLLPVEQLRSAISIEARSKAVALSHQKEREKATGLSGRADIIRVRRDSSRSSEGRKEPDIIRVRRDSSRSSEGRKEHKRSRTMEADIRKQSQVPTLVLNSSNDQQRGIREKTTPPREPTSSSGSAIQIRKIKLTHRENESLGFSIRGGKDLNAGIYVSEVDAGGQAERHGLKVGERVLKVNETPFKNITHTQAVVALKSAHRLTLYVAPVGTMPGSTPNGTPRSEVNSARSAGSQHSIKSIAGSNKRGNSSHGNKQDEAEGSKIKQATIIADDDGWLGCSIRGGVDYEMDVTVANVDPMSPAYRAGLKRGLYINKVNGVNVEMLTHEEIISLVTASNVVVLDVTAAPKKPSQSNNRKAKHLRSQTAEAAITRPKTEERLSSNPSAAQSPKQTGRLAPNYAAFELELQATPPVSTSTPLPPDNHPALIANRQNPTEAQLTSDDALRVSSPDPDGRFVTILHDSGELDGSGNSSTENTPREGAKFDMGTIRLNLANEAVESDQDDGKILNYVVEKCKRTPRKKEHVKDIFHLNANVEEYRTPVSSPKADRNAISGLNTPEKNRYIKANMNILSSPYNNVQQEIRLATYRPSTPSKQLPIMKPLVSSQVQQELTGKRTKPPICPNIPVAQTSPVSKFFKKILRRNSESGSRGAGSLRSSSMESLNEDKLSMNSLGTSTADGSPIHRSAYDLMVENEADVTLL